MKKIKLPEINWEIGGVLKREGGVTYNYAEGGSADGRVWVGVAVMVDGHLEEIIDIENP